MSGLLVSAEEQESVSRSVLQWLNTYTGLPVKINFERLDDDSVGMALSTIQGTFKTRRYICGGYQAQYQFKLILRVQPGNSNDRRLKADELLDTLGDWASDRNNLPVLGNNITAVRVECSTRSSLFATYDNGDEDHQILMTLTYEVI